MPVVRRLLVAGTATAVAVAGGVLLHRADAPSPADREPPSIPLASFDTSHLTILRTAFCDRVPDDAVREALGGEPEDATSYGNGDRVRLGHGVRDRAHEYGCSWTAGDRTAAAWVYAPPVPRAVATELLRRASAAKDCRPVTDAPAYGAPSAAVRCGDEIAFHGLFGDAWLSCSVAPAGPADPDGLLDRGGRWCVAVAQAASAD
jgi:hypothetical protein